MICRHAFHQEAAAINREPAVSHNQDKLSHTSFAYWTTIAAAYFLYPKSQVSIFRPQFQTSEQLNSSSSSFEQLILYVSKGRVFIEGPPLLWAERWNLCVPGCTERSDRVFGHVTSRLTKKSVQIYERMSFWRCGGYLVQTLQMWCIFCSNDWGARAPAIVSEQPSSLGLPAHGKCSPAFAKDVERPHPTL